MSKLVKRIIITDLPDKIEIYHSLEWSSLNENHRILIRNHLINNHTTPNENLKAQYLDLSLRPENPNFSISISHCKIAGGYAIGPNNLGFDMESISRVNKKQVLRISTLHEIESAPSFSHLWTAKESCYKALGEKNQSNKKFSSIKINNWTSLDLNDQEKYSFLGTQDEFSFYGIAFKNEKTKTCLSVVVRA